MYKSVVVLSLTDEEMAKLRKVVEQELASELEKKMWAHCYRLSDAEAHTDTVASYL